MSIISAVTRKRKKCPSTHLLGSSAEEDSEHEPVKTSNCRGGEGGVKAQEEQEQEQEENRGDEGAVKKEHTIPKKEKKDQKENGLEREGNTEGKDSLARGGAAEQDVRNGAGNCAKALERESRQRTASSGATPRVRPNSFVYKHNQIHATYPRPPPAAAGTPSHLKPLPRGRPTVPLWICPARPPNLHQSSSFHGTQRPDWNPSAPVRYRKTRGGGGRGRTRAVSMTLDLEIGRSEDGFRGRGDRVEVVPVVEGTLAQHGCTGVPRRLTGPGSSQQINSFPRFAHEAPALSSSSAWMDQSPHGSSTVVLRRSALNPRDKTKAWRRHTVIV